LNTAPARFDVMVIGAGSAGAVIAARLSEDAHRRVLLIEAGPDEPTLEEALRAIRDANQPALGPGLSWKYPVNIRAEQLRSGPNPRRTTYEYEAGKVVGGSSAVNAVQALRGVPQDYDEWAHECGHDWSWGGVLPYFRALEDDPLGPSDLHGRGGPLPIRREPKEALTPLQAALMEACVGEGFPETHDHNDPDTTGVGVIPKNVVDGVRMSTRLTYLRRAAGRENLTLLSGALVHRLKWAGRKCIGAEVEVGDRLQSMYADAVIVCAGAIGTPAILMRSGIGEPAALKAHGIAVTSPLEGVGQGLMDHPVVALWGLAGPGVSRVGEPLRQTLLRYSSGDSGVGNDMHICMAAGIAAGRLLPGASAIPSAATMAGITVCFNRSRSRGVVRLGSADPRAAPSISLNCLGDPADMLPLKEGVRLAWRLLQRPALATKFERSLAWTDAVMRSDLALERAVTTFVQPSAHLCGSARMGRSPDAGAVVDGSGRVFGVDNLWIVDASIMPCIPSAPTNLTCLMIAEKLASQFTGRVPESLARSCSP